jgi:hypothetical protein
MSTSKVRVLFVCSVVERERERERQRERERESILDDCPNTTGLRLRPKYQPSGQQESSRTMSSWSALYVDDLSTASVAVCGTYL